MANFVPNYIFKKKKKKRKSYQVKNLILINKYNRCTNVQHSRERDQKNESKNETPVFTRH